MRNISNSEVTSWLTCRQQYVFAFMKNLTPKETQVPLARGTLGHRAFELYIQARLNGDSHATALQAAKEAWTEGMKTLTIDLVLETQFLFNRYMEHHKGWPEWELLGTEERHDMVLTEDLGMPMRYDLLVRELRSGKILIGDFKFTYDFWRPEDHDLNPQMPKYIFIMQKEGIEVHGGFLEEVRTRSLGKDKSSDPKNLWRRTYYYPSIARKRSVIKQHVAASLEIEQFRNLDEKQQEDAAIPALNKHGACKFCNFKDLCNSKLDGKDITLDIQVGYTQNTYGYNEQPNSLLELENLL